MKLRIDTNDINEFFHLTPWGIVMDICVSELVYYELNITMTS